MASWLTLLSFDFVDFGTASVIEKQIQTTIENFDSVGGFSIDKTTVVDELRNGKDFNTFELKNSSYSDSASTEYILRGINTAVLQLDNNGTLISIGNNTINFITGNIIAVNPLGQVYNAKLESTLFCNASGATSVLSTMTTIIKDDIPEGQTWSIDPLGGTGTFSYNTVRAGTTNTIKWIAHTKVVSIDWAWC